MGKKKFREFTIPGIYHDLMVKVGKRALVAKKAKDKDTLAYYEHRKARICIGEDLTTNVKPHTLFHEICHHILDTLEDVEGEEDKCNLLGAYLIRLFEAKEEILDNLSGEEKE